MKDFAFVGLAFGPFFMVIGTLNPDGWHMIISFAGSVMLSFSLISMYRTIGRK